ncbi:hypothetical protein V5O48_012119 [Marasmius crinis-equi]|uniref:Uncharacterized protein n=1 Tax=Marasmius crinis-equi TaxID=585013 RepID=A0ABR3F3N4_9AGAR
MVPSKVPASDSDSAAKASVTGKKIKGAVEFVEAAQVIEETRKSELEVVRAKVEATAQVKLAKEKTWERRLELKYQLRKDKMEAKQKREEEKNKLLLQMMQLNYRSQTPTPVLAQGSSSMQALVEGSSSAGTSQVGHPKGYEFGFYALQYYGNSSNSGHGSV